MKRILLYSFFAILFSFLGFLWYQRMNRPLVSVVMLTYQRDNLLPNAINSILNQSFNDYELIILNDGSTDNTDDVIKSFKDNRIRYFKNKKNKGIAFSRNKALKKARGKYVMIMDDDDVSLPNRIEKQVSFLEKNPSIDAVAGQIAGFDRIFNHHDEIASNLINMNSFGNSNVMFRKNFIVRNKIKYPNIKYGEDWHFWLQMLFNGAKFASIDDDVLIKNISSVKHYTPDYYDTDNVIFNLISSFFSPDNPKKFLSSSPCDRLKMIYKTNIISQNYIQNLMNINCL